MNNSKIKSENVKNYILIFKDGKIFEVNNISFNNLVAMLFEEQYLLNPPFKISIPSINKTLFFHEYVFDKYLTSNRVSLEFIFEKLAA